FDPAPAAPRQDVIESIAATGHALEWLAAMPDDLLQDREMISRACEGLLNRLIATSPEVLRIHYNAGTHAANALRIWCPTAWSNARLPSAPVATPKRAS